MTFNTLRRRRFFCAAFTPFSTSAGWHPNPTHTARRTRWRAASAARAARPEMSKSDDAPLAAQCSPRHADSAIGSRKRAIASLPVEQFERSVVLLDPNRGTALQLLHPVRERDRSRLPRQNMDVIRHAADAYGWAVESIANATKVMVHFVAPGSIQQIRPALFR